MVVERLADAAATEQLGARLAGCVGGGGTVFLQGQLGAGKTTLVRGLLRALGYQGPVKSPTYALIESYPLVGVDVHHLDLYRLADAEELEWVGIRDLMTAGALLLVEWPAQGEGCLPAPDLTVALEHRGQGREVEFRPGSDTGAKWLKCLEA